ncbi:MAG: helix-turn-helix transcriptional regulator [Candidatus Niyogibacteria bacterium]|nr:helix-turn-helix transcriptional regulator [Candidatus Niyogibacteria bacterium]
MEQYAKNIGTVIQRHRVDKDITLHALATASGLEEAQMKTIEDGKSFPSLQRLIKIANYLKIKPGWLLIEAEIANFPDDIAKTFKDAIRTSSAILDIADLVLRSGQSAQEIYEKMKK